MLIPNSQVVATPNPERRLRLLERVRRRGRERRYSERTIAADIPSLLATARSAKCVLSCRYFFAVAGGSYRDEPWFSLWSALCHQGNVYTASYAAVPELVEIARARQADHAAARECILLAGVIELERAMPEGRFSPPIPLDIEPLYAAAMSDGAAVARTLRARESDDRYMRGLDMAVASLSGNSTEARRLDRMDRDE